MIKKYKSNSSISINVILPSGSNLHVPFTPLSDGSSEYTTSDENVQYGLEHHYKFGKMFFSVEIPAEPEPNVSEPEAAEESKVVKVKVTDLESAKDYLADNFGVSRTQLRSQKAIITNAALHNIEFEGI